jgi:hypothetical protein
VISEIVESPQSFARVFQNKPEKASDAQIKNACVLHTMAAQLGQSNQRKARLQ